MLRTKLFATLFTAGVLASSVAAMAGMIADPKGNTLYVFDLDIGGTPACYNDCAVKWPPYLGKAGDMTTEGWTLVKRTDDTTQWAYDGKPMYFFEGDKKPGDMAGDGLGGVWHVVKE